MGLNKYCNGKEYHALPCRVFKKGIQILMKGDFMRKKVEMSRLSLHIPSTLYDRIDSDSRIYGITKTALVQGMIVNYYRLVDSKKSSIR